MSERDTQLPLSFRRELLVDVMAALGAGECCSLVGASGVGKSNLVRFIRSSSGWVIWLHEFPRSGWAKLFAP